MMIKLNKFIIIHNREEKAIKEVVQYDKFHRKIDAF